MRKARRIFISGSRRCKGLSPRNDWQQFRSIVRGGVAGKAVRRRPLQSDAAGDVGEVEPDFDATEVGAFGADGSGDPGAEVAGRADVLAEFGMDLAELGDFVER